MNNVTHHEIKLRPAATADQQAIRQLIRSEQLNPFGLKWQRFIIAEISGQMVGCAQLKPHRGGIREFASLAVKPDWRGHGIAARLLNHFLENTPKPLWLMCGNELVPFYEQFDFKHINDPVELPGYLRRLFHISKLFNQPDRFLAIMRHS